MRSSLSLSDRMVIVPQIVEPWEAQARRLRAVGCHEEADRLEAEARAVREHYGIPSDIQHEEAA